ncbi:MAG TPA: DUF4192 domain-containing protein, partial [Nonomuraea sp.]|nr:DUF4192 domain-containing protein [Nonomuraea sp.]
MTTNTSPPSPPSRSSSSSSSPSSSPSPFSSSSAADPFPDGRLTLTSPADILAAIPYLVGFHPTGSLVVIGLTRGQATMVVRWGLPIPPGALAPLPPLFAREGVTQVVIVGYGTGAAVTPAVDEARLLAARAGVRVAEALRADEGRYWSYVCDLPACCPPEGTRHDPTASRVA